MVGQLLVTSGQSTTLANFGHNFHFRVAFWVLLLKILWILKFCFLFGKSVSMREPTTLPPLPLPLPPPLPPRGGRSGWSI